MLQPKVYIKNLDEVLNVELINFDEQTVEVYNCDYMDIEDPSIGFEWYSFDEVEFMENTGYIDKNGKYIYTGDIVEILGAYFEIKYRAYKGYVIKNKKYTLSLEANLDCVSVVGNIYKNKELIGNE